MTLSLNDRALELADRLADDAEALGVAVATLFNGTRVIDCGAHAAGGGEAGRRFAEICMGGLGTITYASQIIGARWLPGVTVTTDRPAVACLASQYAGWRLDYDDYFAMGSGPGRALIHAEDLYDDLDWDEHASAAVLCLETREPPPAEVATFVAQRAGVAPSALTLLMAPTASVAGGVQIAARVVETALHKLHELDFDVRRVVAGFGSCPLPPVAGDDMAALGRTNDAVLYGGQVHLTVEAQDDDDDALRDLVQRLPASASSDYGEPFGSVLKSANFDFYEIDPLLFSPAQIRLTSVASGRSFEAGAVNLEVLERSFWG
jgi:methenyltetrahydromethanopterin cyclohydrolase